MGQISSTDKACRAARCQASGKRQNAVGGLIWPTEGRFPARRGGVALLDRYPASLFEARLATTHRKPVKVAPNSLNRL